MIFWVSIVGIKVHWHRVVNFLAFFWFNTVICPFVLIRVISQQYFVCAHAPFRMLLLAFFSVSLGILRWDANICWFPRNLLLSHLKWFFNIAYNSELKCEDSFSNLLENLIIEQSEILLMIGINSVWVKASLWANSKVDCF